MRLPALHDVDDPEALCRSILKSVLGGNGGYWSASDKEDVLQEMRMLIVRLHRRYDPSLTTMTFCTYATWILRRRAGVDVYRKMLFDKRYGDRAPDLSLDELHERLGLPSAVRRRIERSLGFDESDEAALREEADILTRLSCAVSAIEISPLEALESWRTHLAPQEVT